MIEKNTIYAVKPKALIRQCVSTADLCLSFSINMYVTSRVSHEAPI